MLLQLSSLSGSSDSVVYTAWLVGEYEVRTKVLDYLHVFRRCLFAIEGCITGLISIVSWSYLPASPTQTAVKSGRNPIRSKSGWFLEHEEKVMANRVIRDDPSKGDMHNRQASGAPS